MPKTSESASKNNSDSDEEDEDYVPGVDDGEAASDDDENDATYDGDNIHATALSITKQKAVDDAFLELFGYDYVLHPSEKSIDKIPIKACARSLKQRRILSFIFGRNSCRKLMSLAQANAAMAKPKPSSGGMIRLEKRVVKEVKRFAGQEIFVEKVVMVPVMMGDENDETDGVIQQSSVPTTDTSAASQSPRTRASKSGPAKGLDSLLTTLSRPEKLSTISKTSADWDLFKSQSANSQLKEELETKAKGKEAYLVKKDFLSRVDERRFEIEKGERERERGRRGGNNYTMRHDGTTIEHVGKHLN
ncbi:hypothetical protein HJC23_012952 [Cyclotella cryptica]|uniref:BCNT-C domain-containing protein n=1 Tax=Cyclotella cryptica TaxID=29204 RepID=A0ABD3Q8B8_9STRA|eukprot:CCRYP_009317-RA/>CCRYP_009317-RA protein AED:0.09 eAED:0.09 QI:0/-1/0/1/-1/1/1/0/303